MEEFLKALYRHELSVESEDALLECTGMVCDLARFSGGLPSWFALDHDIEVDEFLGEGRHVVCEAEGVFTDGVCGEDEVALPLTGAVEEKFVVGILYVEIDVKGASRLHGEVELRQRKGKSPVKSELVDIEEALKAGQAVESASEMQLSCAMAVGRPQLASNAHAAAVVNCTVCRRKGVVRCTLRRLGNWGSFCWRTQFTLSRGCAAAVPRPSPRHAL